MGDGVGISDFESAGLQIVAKIEFRAADKKSAFGIDDHVDFAGSDENVAVGGAIDEVHFVLQTGAPAADYGDAECAVGAVLFGQQTGQARAGAFGDFDQFFVADFVIYRGFHELGDFKRFGLGVPVVNFDEGIIGLMGPIFLRSAKKRRAGYGTPPVFNLTSKKST